MTVKPRTKVPALDLPLVGGGRFNLPDCHPRSFTMIVAAGCIALSARATFVISTASSMISPRPLGWPTQRCANG
jgi:hypothetical protein